MVGFFLKPPLALFGALLALGGLSPQEAQRPHILLIMAENVRKNVYVIPVTLQARINQLDFHQPTLPESNALRKGEKPGRLLLTDLLCDLATKKLLRFRSSRLSKVAKRRLTFETSSAA